MSTGKRIVRKDEYSVYLYCNGHVMRPAKTSGSIVGEGRYATVTFKTGELNCRVRPAYYMGRPSEAERWTTWPQDPREMELRKLSAGETEWIQRNYQPFDHVFEKAVPEPEFIKTKDLNSCQNCGHGWSRHFKNRHDDDLSLEDQMKCACKCGCRSFKSEFES